MRLREARERLVLDAEVALGSARERGKAGSPWFSEAVPPRSSDTAAPKEKGVRTWLTSTASGSTSSSPSPVMWLLPLLNRTPSTWTAQFMRVTGLPTCTRAKKRSMLGPILS